LTLQCIIYFKCSTRHYFILILLTHSLLISLLICSSQIVVYLFISTVRGFRFRNFRNFSLKKHSSSTQLRTNRVFSPIKANEWKWNWKETDRMKINTSKKIFHFSCLNEWRKRRKFHIFTRLLFKSRHRCYRKKNLKKKETLKNNENEDLICNLINRMFTNLINLLITA
jgi:hypothetical protein